MKNKKIFFVADAKSIHTAKWIDYFVEQNYDVYLATFSDVNNTKCTNVFFLANRAANNLGGNYHYLFSIIKLSKILKDINPYIINAHYSYSMGLIALLAKYKSKVKSSFSVVCHGSDILSPPKPYIVDRINTYVLKKCDKVFVVSDQIKDKVEALGINLNKVFIGQYGLNLQKKVVTKDIDILSNRAYNDNSRIDFLLECIDKIDNKSLNIIFVLPNIQDNDFKLLVKKYPYIKFYKHLDHISMMDLMNRTKLYISATKSDGTSLSLLEAMNFQCIPIVSNIVSNRSWILNGINGYLFNTKNDFIKSLVNALEINETIKNKIFGINARLLHDNGNYSIQMKKIEAFLMDVK